MTFPVALEVVGGRQSILSSTNELMSVAFIYISTYIVILCKLYHNTQVAFPVALEVVSGRQSILSSTNEHMSVAFLYVHTCFYMYVHV